VVLLAGGHRRRGAPTARLIVALGDSITDGHFSTPDTDHSLAGGAGARLAAQKATANIAVVNMGSAATGCCATSPAPARWPASIAMC